jgi:mRNA degradation ribonuclease J1/J2
LLRCADPDLNILLCEGTRVNEEFSKTESDVEKDVTSFAYETQELVVCTYPEGDLDRLLSFYNAAK